MDSQSKTTIEDLLGPLNEVERKNAPKALFFAGDLGLLDAGPRVSIVGSRKASARGLNNARGLAAWLVRRGAVVVSGLAEGIDAAAHQGAIDAGGRTIGVIGTAMGDLYLTRDEVTTLHKLLDTMEEEAGNLAAQGGAAAAAASEIADNVALMRDVVEQASRAAEP